MPLVRVEILKGKSSEYKKALLDGIHQALVDTLKVPEDDRIQRLYELEKDNFELPPSIIFKFLRFSWPIVEFHFAFHDHHG